MKRFLHCLMLAAQGLAIILAALTVLAMFIGIVCNIVTSIVSSNVAAVLIWSLAFMIFVLLLMGVSMFLNGEG